MYIKHFKSAGWSFVIGISDCGTLKCAVGAICGIIKSAILIIALVKHGPVETSFVAFDST
jgi:hypothetical protein